MATRILNPTVDTKERIPTPKYNTVSLTIKVPSTETNGLNLYDGNSPSTAVFTVDPGDNIAITISSGESFYWEGNGGECNPQFIGEGW